MTKTASSLRDIPDALRPNYLVGAFLNYFAQMEFSLDLALQNMLGLDAIRALIVTKPTPFGAKVSMFRTLSTIAVPEVGERMATLASALMKANNDRTIAAHYPFGASPSSDGVRFIVMRAKDKLDFPEADWSTEEFHLKITEMERIRLALDAEIPKKTYSAVAQALNAKPTPGILGGLFAAGAALDEQGQD